MDSRPARSPPVCGRRPRPRPPPDRAVRRPPGAAPPHRRRREHPRRAARPRRPSSPTPTTAPLLDRLQRARVPDRRAEDAAPRAASPRPGWPCSVPRGSPTRPRCSRAAGVTSCTRGLGADADVVLALSTGEIARDRLDPLIRRRHQPSRRTPGRRGGRARPLRGPRTDRVPALHRRPPEHRATPTTSPSPTATSARPRGARADGVPDVRTPCSPRVAVAWAVRDVVAHLDGHASLDLVADRLSRPRARPPAGAGLVQAPRVWMLLARA